MGKLIHVNAALPRFLLEQTALLTRRMSALGAGIDGPRRDINAECQYPTFITNEMYWEMYTREGYGKKVVDSLPNECFTSHPEIKENEKSRLTPFERAWYDLEDSEIAPVHWLHELDKRSGVCRYGILLIGLNDGMPLDSKAKGIKDDGRIDEQLAFAGIPVADGLPTRPSGKTEIIYLRAFGEGECRVAEIETDPTNRRYMMPRMYEVSLLTGNAFMEFQTSGMVTQSLWQRVHWSRVIHVADNCGPGMVLGVPRMTATWNRLADIRKILGADAEAFWKSGSPGLAVTADAKLLEAGTVEVDEDSIKEQLKLFMDGLQKYLILVGANATTLAPNISDPRPHILVHLNAIACALDQPLRIFTGAEEAKVASGHDIQMWGRRVARRQNNYVTPWIVRAFIDRCIMLKVLPATKEKDSNGRPKYKVEWPPINQATADEQSTIADRFADAILKFTQARGYEMIQPSDFWRIICGLEQDIVDVIMNNVKNNPPEIPFTDPSPPQGGDTGVAGKPNSDPKPKTVK